MASCKISYVFNITQDFLIYDFFNNVLSFLLLLKLFSIRIVTKIQFLLLS